MLKWLTDWGWYCFAGGWRRVASRHRWSETKMIKVWRVGWGAFVTCFCCFCSCWWTWWMLIFGWFWLILADFASRFHAELFGLRRADCWHGPRYDLKLPMDLTRLNISCHWLSLVVIDCHVSFVHLCPYFYIFVHVHPCSSLFQFANACPLQVRLVVAVSTSQRVGGRRRTGRRCRCRCAVRWAPRTDDRLGGRFPSKPWTPKK